MDTISIMAPFISGLIFAAFAFSMIKFVPTLREFDAHKKQEDERYNMILQMLVRVDQSIRDTKADIVREVQARVHNADD